jgi:hypothetical protein
MIALEVRLNGMRLCLAGADDLCVLNAILTVGGSLGSKTVRERRNPDSIDDGTPVPTLHIGGLTSRGGGQDNEHLRWANNATVSIGDTVEMRLMDIPAGAQDHPVVEANPKEISEYRRFLAAKAQYFALREKFEPLPAP